MYSGTMASCSDEMASVSNPTPAIRPGQEGAGTGNVETSDGARAALRPDPDHRHLTLERIHPRVSADGRLGASTRENGGSSHGSRASEGCRAALRSAAAHP